MPGHYCLNNPRDVAARDLHLHVHGPRFDSFEGGHGYARDHGRCPHNAVATWRDRSGPIKKPWERPMTCAQLPRAARELEQSRRRLVYSHNIAERALC